MCRTVRGLLFVAFAVHGLGAIAADAPTPDLGLSGTSKAINPNEEVVRRYIRACNEVDRDLLGSVFAEDVRIYFIGLPPVVGREKAAQFWSDFNQSKHTVWTIDHVLVSGDEVVIEWSALRGRDKGAPKLDRGSEWYVVKDGKIAEIRQYYDVRGDLPIEQEYELSEFPYLRRGYSTKENFMETLP